MENYLNLMIIGVICYDIDGNWGGLFWVYLLVEVDDDNCVGNEVMKIICDYKYIDQLWNYVDCLLVMFIVKVQMKVGQGGKVIFKVLEFKFQEFIKKFV